MLTLPKSRLMSSEASARFFILFYDGSRVFAIEQKKEEIESESSRGLGAPDGRSLVMLFSRGDVNSRIL